MEIVKSRTPQLDIKEEQRKWKLLTTKITGLKGESKSKPDLLSFVYFCTPFLSLNNQLFLNHHHPINNNWPKSHCQYGMTSANGAEYTPKTVDLHGRLDTSKQTNFRPSDCWTFRASGLDTVRHLRPSDFKTVSP